MNSTQRHLMAAPMAALLLVAFVMAMVSGTEKASVERPSYLAEARAIVKAEIAREAAGADCVDPKALKPGQFPKRVLVSEQNADLTATSVESMTFDAAWEAAQAGRVTIRCAIV